MKRFWIAGLALLMMTGCYDPRAQSSKIIQELQNAGSGNLSTYTPQGLADWLSKRPELAKHIALECAPLEQKADAHWLETAEGTVCHVAETVQPPPVVLSDGRSW